MKANVTKRLLVGTLAMTLLLGSTLSVSATTSASSSSSSSSKKSKAQESIVESVQSEQSEQSDDGSAVSSVAAAVAQIPTSSAVAGVQSTLPGVYLATDVNGTAISTGLTTIADSYGLTQGEQPYARIYNFDGKKSYLAQACIDNAAASLGAAVGPAINVEIGKLASGKFSLLPADGAEITLKVGIPKSFAQDGKTYAVVAVRPGGVVSILSDTDSDPNTVTFDTTAGQAAYAFIKY